MKPNWFNQNNGYIVIYCVHLACQDETLFIHRLPGKGYCQMAKEKGKHKINRDALWVDAKRRCRLNMDDIRMAKEMGLNPRSLIKNIPSPSELWKAPVKQWIREMYEKRQNIKVRKKEPVDNGNL